ncbi:MAG TPA: radical SAM protein [bacterium]|nr:radical SAM protein [bacterium]
MVKDFSFQWHITDLCNLRCRHCYQDRFDKERELPVEDCGRIISDMVTSLELSGYESLSINITGGEPLISPLLYPILDLLDRIDFIKELNIITNGLVLKSSYPRLKGYKKLKYIKVSLEGSTEEMNDSIRGKGNFKRVIENIKDFTDDVILMFTLTSYNYRELNDMYNLADFLNVRGFILERFIPLGTGRGMADKVLKLEEWLYVLKIISDWLDISLEYLIPYKAFFIDLKEDDILGALCNLGDESMCLMPDGIVYPCRRLPVPAGDLKIDSFDRVLRELKFFREKINRSILKGKCGHCQLDDCIGCRALAYATSGDIYSEDKQCPKDRYGRITLESK